MHAHNATSCSSPARRGNLLIGCGVVLALLVAVIIGLGIWVATSWKGWVAGGTHDMINAALTEAQIDDVERQEILVHVDDLMQRFENGDIEFEQLMDVLEAFAQSPLVPTMAVSAVDTVYIEDSALEDEEKAQARIELLRYANGLSDRTIDPNTMDEVIKSIEDSTPDGTGIEIARQISVDGSTTTRELKTPEEATPEDLRALIAAAKAHADEAGIPAQPTPIDLSDEVQLVIQKGLGELPPEAGAGTPDVPDQPAVDAPDAATDPALDDANADLNNEEDNDGP